MKNLLLKSIETFFNIYFLIFKKDLNNMIIINFYPWKSISH